jgi:hypothetical protein
LVERFHRQLKNALQVRVIAADWCDHLPWVMLGIGICTDFHSPPLPPPKGCVSQLVLTGQFVNMAESPSPSFLEELQTAMAGLIPPPTLHTGPSLVLELSTHFFLLQIGERTDKVSMLRLKPAQTPADTELAQLPRRGRPAVQTQA